MPIAAPPPAPPPPAVAASVRPTASESAIVQALNRIRRTHGLRRLRITGPLTDVARDHSADMLEHGVLSHSSFDGSSFSVRLQRAGRRTRYGETLAWVPDGADGTARSIVRMWMDSPSHRAIVLDGALRRVGVGRVTGAMGTEVGFAVTADFTS